jgi:ATP-dependent RNA helicase DeaD
MEEFKKLGVIPEILKSLEEQKISMPTEIQGKTIPLVLAGKDVIAGAATGSGKTLAFGAGIIQNCEKSGVIQSLVLVPTRELADQVARTLKHFSKYKNLEFVEVFGGVSMSPQIQKLRRADVVVGTPGRILDHLEHETIDLRYVKILVLDEADRMLDMGFIRDVRRIIQHVPQKRQTMLFSATISQDIKRLSHDYMTNPVEIMAETNVDPSKLKQVYYDVPDNMKFSLLVHLLKEDHSGLIMVFCNTQRNTDFVAENLHQSGINAVAIHGGHSQDKRIRTMEQFHSKDVQVLVCTDVAARGLDIKDVSHVYNYDIPNEPNQYVHRIGRTARAGAEGIAVSILASRDYENFTQVRRHNPDSQIEKKELPNDVRRIIISFKDSHFRRPSSRFGGQGRGSGGFRGRGEREERNMGENRFRARSGFGGRRDRRETRSRFHSRY